MTDELFKPRRHQAEFDDWCRRIATGDPIKEILAFVTVGGGKGSLAVIAAARLIDCGFAQKVLHVVPRLSLQRQAAKVFKDEDKKKYLGHAMQIMESTNDLDPSRGTAGYTTTYNAIGEDPKLHFDEFRLSRYILVLDEIHHVSVGSKWHRALQPLVEMASLVVYMTGALERSDGKSIAFLPYVDRGNDREYIDLESTSTRKVIRYTRAKAFEDKAVIPIEFYRIGGDARWIDCNGDDRQIDSLADSGTDAPAAIYTALNTDYARHLLMECYNHFLEHKDKHNSRAKLLVVAPRIKLARRYLGWLRDDFGARNVGLAVSGEDGGDGDGKSALENIERLKGKKTPVLDILVTVAMAYEGMDVPEITHIACLTNIRATPWIDQMIGRATRVDYHKEPLPAAPAWEAQCAHIWGPDDPLLTACIEQMRAEQAPFVQKPQSPGVDGPDLPKGPILPITPIDGKWLYTRASDFHGGEEIDAEEYQRIFKAAKEAGLSGLSPTMLKRFLDIHDRSQQEDSPGSDPKVVDIKEELTITQQMDRFRAMINNYVNAASEGDAERIRQMNTNCIKVFGKGRGLMHLKELQEAWDTRTKWAH